MCQQPSGKVKSTAANYKEKKKTDYLSDFAKATQI